MVQSISPKLNPQKFVILSFLGAIAVFTLLLKLPMSGHENLSWIDAAFTATSGVCVTGLSVINVGEDLTRAGQIVLLLAIQVGGLGIMTYSVFFTLLLRGRTTLVSRLSVGLTSHRGEARDILHVLGFVLAMTLSFEAIGSVLIFQRLKDFHAGESAFFSSIFHAVSAFCNAGFSLYSDSLEKFNREFYLPGCVSALIVLGGLGFMVIDEVRAWLLAIVRRQKFRLSLHTRVCLTASLVLIILGALVIFFLERGNLLMGMNFFEQAMNAVFLSITSRTAGFNMIDTGLLSNASLFFIMILMFIGGCPGSAAGGVKVTTFTILAALVKDQARFRQMTSVFKRKVPNATVAKALAIFAAGLVLVIGFTLLFQITEKAGVPAAAARPAFLDLFFETVSGFGTVGLSTGATSSLSFAGKLLMIVLMFVGRVGPLTIALVVMTQKKTEPKFEYVEEDVVAG